MAISFISSIVFAASERNMGHGICCDYSGGFVYQFYMTPTAARGGIAKIRISDFTRVANVTFACSPASSGGGGAVVDAANGFAYIVNGNRIKQLNLAGFSVGLDSFFGDANGEIVIDSAGTYLYTSLYSNGTARRILATSLGLVNQVVVGSARVPTAVAVDFTRGFMYTGLNDTSSDGIKKVRLSDFTLVSTIIPGAGVNQWHSASYDALNDRIYFAGSRLLKLNPADDSFVVHATPAPNLTGGNAGFVLAAPNAGTGVVYVGNGSAGTTIISEVDIATFTVVNTLTLTGSSKGATGGARDPVTGKLYVCSNQDPGRVDQLQGIPDNPSAVPVSGGPNVKRRPYPYNGATISSAW